MRKLLAFVVLFAGLFAFSGCTKYDGDDTIVYPWQVILIMKYELKSEAVPFDAMDILHESTGFDVFQSGTVVQVELRFENFEDFQKMFHVEQLPVHVVTKKKLFFIERTITFENPIGFIENSRTPLDVVDQKVHAAYSTYINNGYGLYFVLESAFRRSKVDTAYKYENKGTYYNYYFREDVGEIQIFDRYANQPIWYTLALGATAIFMVIVYLICLYFKKKRDKMGTCLSPFSATSTGI